MKDTVGAERKFAIYTQFLDTTLWGETEVQEGETRQEARARLLNELEEDAARLRRENSGRLSEDDQLWNLTKPLITPVIDRSDEKIEAAIDNADTPEKLQQVKVDFPVMSVKMMGYYNMKNKILQ